MSKATTAKKPPKPRKPRIVIAGGKAFDLNAPEYDWLKAFDMNSRLYILSGIAKD